MSNEKYTIIITIFSQAKVKISYNIFYIVERKLKKKGYHYYLILSKPMTISQQNLNKARLERLERIKKTKE